MMNVDFSFASASSGMNSNSFLFAHPERPFVRGESTSDYLAYFGFGSGYNFGNERLYPAWLKGTYIYELFDPKQNFQDALTSVLTTVARIADHYYEHGFRLDRYGIKRMFITLFRMYGVTCPSHRMDQLCETVLIGYNPLVHKAVASTVLFYGVNRSGDYYIQLGLPEVPDWAKFNCYPLASEKDLVTHNWRYSSNVGGFGHTENILHAISRHTFSPNFSKEVLDNMITKISNVYPLILI